MFLGILFYLGWFLGNLVCLWGILLVLAGFSGNLVMLGVGIIQVLLFLGLCNSSSWWFLLFCYCFVVFRLVWWFCVIPCGCC